MMWLKRWGWRRRELILVLWICSITLCHADTQQIVDYKYDVAGNLVQIESNSNQAPPSVGALSPDIIRIGMALEIQALGANLSDVKITSDVSELLIEVIHTDSTTARFKLQALDTVALGVHTLTFTNRIGSTTVVITVHPRLPKVLISPSPLVVSEGGALALKVELSSADIFPHSLSFDIADPKVGSLSLQSLTFDSGATSPNESQLIVNGLALGVTTLKLQSESLGDSKRALFVAPSYSPLGGEQTIFSQPLGLWFGPPVPPTLLTRGPFSSQVSIFKESFEVSQPMVYSPVVTSEFSYIKGNGVSGLMPTTFIRGGKSQRLEIKGVGLEAVTRVDIVPADGITIGSPLLLQDGSGIWVDITLESEAAIGFRQVEVIAGQELVSAIYGEASQIFIAAGLPEIISISPFVMKRNQLAEIMIRGNNFQDTRRVTLSPADDLTLGSFSVNAEGDMLRMKLVVDEYAKLGSRPLTVTTGAGDSALTWVSRLQIVNGPLQDFHPLVSPILGLVRESDDELVSSTKNVYSSVLGYLAGSWFSGVSPGLGIVGERLTLTLTGRGLDAVDSVQMHPVAGVIIGEPQASADGSLLTVSLTIAADAVQGLRQIEVFANGSALPALPIGANEFLISAKEPVIDVLSPINIEADGRFIDLSISGQHFSNVVGVRAIPADGLTFGRAIVAADSMSLRVPVTASKTAKFGSRTIVVDTLSGASSTKGDETNTLHIMAGPLQDITLLSKPLGINKSLDTPPSESSLFAYISQLGLLRQFSPIVVSQEHLILASSLGFGRGSLVESVLPSGILVGSDIELIVDGKGLLQVATASFFPDDGLTVGALSVNDAGTRLRVPVSVAADATKTLRALTLETESGEPVFYSRPEVGQLKITGPISITSIEPIQEAIGKQFTLLVRGLNLKNILRVEMIPSDGVTIASPVVEEANGTQLRIPISISGWATPGARLFRIITITGSSLDVMGETNTFTILAK